MSNSSGPLPSSFDGNEDFYQENRWQKLSRRLKEEPLVPLGCALTCYALYRATTSIRRGDHNQANRMFRARIYAQGFTLLALAVGSFYYGKEREKRKEFQGMVAEKKALEKREAWIRELEARDQEEKELREKRKRAREESGMAKSVIEWGERRGLLRRAILDIGIWRR
ncbi:Respiratory supercomplex factor 1, mitochondrial [Glutinoglossum americanum]|uniref:Respiratory supercomplex factor 1, mitochondrial n=1 Tax=Glutinoglossum americanum TaxID=1670608 RepID=A0A9P8I247_9PEZI|nr:Respiratory supercomplex factor 1, mitochondrial [Glutinoglossum americanum]